MIERLKKQNPKKLLIMIWNVLRMGLYKLLYGNKINASLIQNISPSTEIAVGKGKLFLNGLSRKRKSDDMRRLRRYFLQWAGIENIDAIDANRRRKD